MAPAPFKLRHLAPQNERDCAHMLITLSSVPYQVQSLTVQAELLDAPSFERLLVVCKRVRHLVIHGCTFRGASSLLPVLARALPYVETLVLRSCSIMQAKAITTAVPWWRALETLKLRDCLIYGDDDSPTLVTAPSIRTLVLHGTRGAVDLPSVRAANNLALLMLLAEGVDVTATTEAEARLAGDALCLQGNSYRIQHLSIRASLSYRGMFDFYLPLAQASSLRSLTISRLPLSAPTEDWVATLLTRADRRALEQLKMELVVGKHDWAANIMGVDWETAKRTLRSGAPSFRHLTVEVVATEYEGPRAHAERDIEARCCSIRQLLAEFQNRKMLTVQTRSLHSPI